MDFGYTVKGLFKEVTRIFKEDRRISHATLMRWTRELNERYMDYERTTSKQAQEIAHCTYAVAMLEVVRKALEENGTSSDCEDNPQ